MDQVLDMEVVEELLALTGDGDPELLLDLIHMFLEDAPSKLEAMNEGLGKGDLEQVVHAAHSLKGSAGNLGIRMVQADCDALQDAGRLNQLERIRELVPQLEENFSQAIAALEDLKGRFRSS
jgi:osomolarity two-component system phosphorelay intermediate protein YPD1